MPRSDEAQEVRVAAVVLTLGRDTTFRQVVAELIAQGMAPARICVVHNRVGATEPPADPGRFDVELIELADNRGYSGGMNAGLRHQMLGDADWIWVLTQDVLLRPHALAGLAREAAGARAYGALGPTLYDAGTGLVFSRGGTITARGEFVHLPWRRAAVSSPAADPQNVTSCDWLDGSCVFLRVKALSEVGLFDERLHSYCEDVDLCWRLKQAGWGVGTTDCSEAAQSVGQSRRPGAYAFFVTRNTLACRHRIRGRRSVADGVARRLWLVGSSLKRALAARGNVEERRRQWATAVGTFCGVVAYFARRWGPAPPWLPGCGDLREPSHPTPGPDGGPSAGARGVDK